YHSSFFFNAPATTQTYTLSLHDALPISANNPCRRGERACMRKLSVSLLGVLIMVAAPAFATIFSTVKGVVHDPQHRPVAGAVVTDRKSTRLNSSHVSISYAVFCLKKKKT